MQRYDIIQHLIDYHGYKSYLEIGICNTTFTYNTWKRVKCMHKVGVDPAITYFKPEPLFSDEQTIDIWKKTSDEFFPELKSETQFDLIFIDGLHIADQVERDIQNSLRHLSPGGTIVLHDCNPPTLAHAGEEPEIFKGEGDNRHFVWCGTVWKAVSKLCGWSGLDFETVDTDWGVGILQLRAEIDYEVIMEYIINKPSLSWELFDKDRAQLLTLITVDEFKARYPIA